MLVAALIVRDEVKTLERTISVVRPYVSTVVIGVDAASKDGTRELAHKLADIVIETHLAEELEKSESVEGDSDWGFSRARNKVFDACPKDSWRLILDGHEVVRNPDKLSQLVSEAIIADCDGVEIPIYFEPNSSGLSQVEYMQIRLMAPTVRYVNPEHNVPLVLRKHVSTLVGVEHRRQDQAPESRKERNEQRSVCNVRGFKKLLESSPTDARSWFYLATAYKENAQYAEAVDAYQQCLIFSKFNEERWHARINMGTCYLHLKAENLARDQFTLALEEYPAMAETYYYLGQLAYGQKKYREAQVWLEKCVQLDEPNARLFVTPKIYRIDRYDLLSMIYHHLHQPAKAIEQAEIALAGAPNDRITANITHWKKAIAACDTVRYDDIWSARPDASPWENTRVKMMAEALNGATTVLDIGSGPGWIQAFLPKGTKYTGVDISPVARKLVEAKGGRSVESLDVLNGEKFDACVLGEVLEHLVNDIGTLLEAKRHVSEGGTIVVSVPRYAAMYDPAHVRDYTRAELETLLYVAGQPEKIGLVGPWVIYSVVV